MESSTAFKKGYFAARAGVVIGDNPYLETEEDHWQWLNGHTHYKMEMT